MVLDIEKITSVQCACGHKMLYHYAAEGPCDRSGCECMRFKLADKGWVVRLIRRLLFK